MNLAEKFKRH